MLILKVTFGYKARHRYRSHNTDLYVYLSDGYNFFLCEYLLIRSPCVHT